MTSGMRTLIFPAKDLGAAKRLFSALLGRAPAMDEPYYVGFELEGLHFGLDPNGHATGMTGPVGYWHVDDIVATLTTLLDAGAEQEQTIRDVGGGTLIATVKDADGNVLGLLQRCDGA